MKDIVGPCRAGLLRPIYDPEITDEEAEYLADPSSFGKLFGFSESVKGLLRGRFGELVEGSDGYRELIELNDSSPGLFYNRSVPPHIFNEAIGSGVVVPLTIASQIYRL